MREVEVQSRIDFKVGIDGLAGNIDAKGMSGDNREGGDAAVEGEETKSEWELEPAALRSGVGGREPEVETPAKVCAKAEGTGVGLRRVRGCG